MLLICGSFAEMFANYTIIYQSFLQLLSPLFRRLRMKELDDRYLIHDPAPHREQVPMGLWGLGIIASILLPCLILGLRYKQNVGVTLLAIHFAFLFSYIGAESRAGQISLLSPLLAMHPNLSLVVSHMLIPSSLLSSTILLVVSWPLVRPSSLLTCWAT
jgi:hypothetical protein